jgi:GTPase SAR1 family protein
LRNSAGAILVFDLMQKTTFKDVNIWINDLNTLCLPNATIILVGNKSDLTDDRTVSDTEAQEWAKQYNLDNFETSAKTGDHVADAFVRLGQGILRQYLQSQGGPTPNQDDEAHLVIAGDRKASRGSCTC